LRASFERLLPDCELTRGWEVGTEDSPWELSHGATCYEHARPGDAFLEWSDGQGAPSQDLPVILAVTACHATRRSTGLDDFGIGRAVWRRRGRCSLRADRGAEPAHRVRSR
jgi:hypothetical protein